MAGEPLISVVMPARNAELTIEQALHSLQAQTHADWEALVIDDGSTDTTAATVARLARGDTRITAISGRGEGVAAARNIGIVAARGQWLAFLDADDWLDPDFMTKMLTALEGAPDHRIAYCSYLRVMPDGSTMHDYMDNRLQTTPCEVFSRLCAVSINSLLLDRQMVVDAGGFDRSLATCEDWDLWQRLARAGERWLPVYEPLAYYRASAGSLTRDSRQMLKDGRTVIARAFAPDPRVLSPLPPYADSMSGEGGLSEAETFGWFAFWNLIIAAVHGVNDLPPVPELASLEHGPNQSKAFADTFIHALSIALCKPPERLAACWDEYAAAVDRVIAELGSAWGDPIAERRVRYALDRRLLEHDDLAEPRLLGLTVGLRMAARDPVFTALPSGRDAIYSLIELDDEVLAFADPGALGSFGAFEWVDQMFFPKRGRKSIGPWIAALARPLPISHALARYDLDPDAPAMPEQSASHPPQALRARLTEREAALAEGEALLARQHHIYPRGSHSEALARIAIEARADALAAAGPTLPPVCPRHAGPAEAAAGEQRWSVPALRFQSVSETGPEALRRYRQTPDQLRERLHWLRDHGYHAITAHDVESHLASELPFTGRPVWLTFDQGFCDFAQHAWPELRAVGMTADVFLVTDQVGRSAACPGGSGAPSPVMDVGTIVQLASEGVFFASHMATHRAADGLSTEDLAREMLRSRALIERWIGSPPVAIAAPFGATDGRFGRLAEQCGYGLALGGDTGRISIGDSGYALPRLEVRGDQPMEEFIAMMEQAS
ncbi:MAG: glycosyltransferase [Pseudomonadota bacterium]